MNTKYAAIIHTDSNRSRKRGLSSPLKPRVTAQLIRHPEGFELPHLPLKVSSHTPHVGAKQLAKLKTRNHVSA